MREQVVGLFRTEESVVEAAQILNASGYHPTDLDLVSTEPLHDPSLPLVSRHVRLGRLMERPEGTLPYALRWAVIGSLVVEIPVLIWVIIAFGSWGIQVFLGSTLWKFGAFFGGLLGAIVGADRGLESEAVHRYQEQLALGAFALAARVEHRDAPYARGIFIESCAFDIRTVEGRFIAKSEPLGPAPVPDMQESTFNK